MKAKSKIGIILLLLILLISIVPMEAAYACACGGSYTIEPEPEPEPEVAEPEPEPEPVKKESVTIDRDTSIDNIKEEEKVEEKKEEVQPVKPLLIEKKFSKTSFIVGESVYIVDSEEVEMDGIPFIEEDRIMLPLRYVAEALGMDVDFDEETLTATFSNEDVEIKIQVITGEMTLNGEVFEAEVAPQLVNDRTYVSIGVIAETLGMTREDPESGFDLSWYQETQTAVITREIK